MSDEVQTRQSVQCLSCPDLIDELSLQKKLVNQTHLYHACRDKKTLQSTKLGFPVLHRRASLKAYDGDHPLVSSNNSAANVAWSNFGLIDGNQAAGATNTQASKDSADHKGWQSGGRRLASYANGKEDEEAPDANASTKPVADGEREPWEPNEYYHQQQGASSSLQGTKKGTNRKDGRDKRAIKGEVSWRSQLMARLWQGKTYSRPEDSSYVDTELGPVG